MRRGGGIVFLKYRDEENKNPTNILLFQNVGFRKIKLQPIYYYAKPTHGWV